MIIQVRVGGSHDNPGERCWWLGRDGRDAR